MLTPVVTHIISRKKLQQGFVNYRQEGRGLIFLLWWRWNEKLDGHNYGTCSWHCAKCIEGLRNLVWVVYISTPCHACMPFLCDRGDQKRLPALPRPQKLVSRAKPFTDLCPPGRKGLVTRAHTFSDFPHDSWGTVLPRVLLIGSCGFFTLP